MSEKPKVIIVKKRKKKKVKKRKKTKQPMLSQKVSQNVKIIINDRPVRRRKPTTLAVRGFNTPRVNYQPPTIIQKGLDAETAINGFRNIFGTRIRALESGLNGVNGNMTSLTSQIQHLAPPPLVATPIIPSPQLDGLSNADYQNILDQRMAERVKRQQDESNRVAEKDFYNSPAGEQGYEFIPEEFIPFNKSTNKSTPVKEDALPEEEVVLKKPRKKRTPEERADYDKRQIEQKQIKQQVRGMKQLEFSEKDIKDADNESLVSMIIQLDGNDSLFDNMNGIQRGKVLQARNYVRQLVRDKRKQRKQFQQTSIEESNIAKSSFQNL